jgi:hypothetical protein
MARFASAYRTSGAGSATLPMASLYAQANTPLWVVEVGITNTTAVLLEVTLQRLSSTGTQGTAQTVIYEENDTITVKGDPRQTHSVLPTLVAGEVRRASIGASVGSGVIFTFGGRGLYIPPGTANGVGLLPISTTGQICDVYWSWDA